MRTQSLAVGEFLRACRARTSPKDVDLAPGGRRRISGLRREEVALLAGISVTWYTAIEQGRATHVSRRVLEDIASALRLDAPSTRHLLVLADVQATTSGRVSAPQRRRLAPELRVELQVLLDSLSPTPAHVLDPFWNRIAWNEARCAFLWQDLPGLGNLDRNVLWRLFTDVTARDRSDAWEAQARRELAEFRVSTAPYVGNSALQRFIEALSAASPEFRHWWPENLVRDSENVRVSGTHPVTGAFALHRVELALQAAPDLRVVCHLATDPDNERFLHRTLELYRRRFTTA